MDVYYSCYHANIQSYRSCWSWQLVYIMMILINRQLHEPVFVKNKQVYEFSILFPDQSHYSCQNGVSSYVASWCSSDFEHSKQKQSSLLSNHITISKGRNDGAVMRAARMALFGHESHSITLEHAAMNFCSTMFGPAP